MCKPSHVFIVGLSRTGTTLTRSMLNQSEHIGLGGESMYFGDRRWLGLKCKDGYREKFARVGNLRTDYGVKGIVDYIYNIRYGNFWSKLAGMVDRAEFERRLLESDRSERALLDLAYSYYAGGKSIRGEKTPANLYVVPQLFEWFPDAKVIHAFRDPRAIYISNKRKYESRRLPRLSRFARRTGLLFELYSSLDVIFAWLRAIRMHREYARRYASRYCLSKFEELLREPAGTMQRMCGFLDVPFEDSMLDQLVLNSSFLPRRQKAGIDKSAVDRWRQHLHPLINRWFLLWCKPRLDEFGYSI